MPARRSNCASRDIPISTTEDYAVIAALTRLLLLAHCQTSCFSNSQLLPVCCYVNDLSCAMQSASLVLTTTPPEQLAAGLTSLLWPLRLVGVPTKEIGACGLAWRSRLLDAAATTVLYAVARSSRLRLPQLIQPRMPQPVIDSVAIRQIPLLQLVRVWPRDSEQSSATCSIRCAENALRACAGLTLLLSLRFMSLVFEEARNIAMGLAARNVDWKTQVPSEAYSFYKHSSLTSCRWRCVCYAGRSILTLSLSLSLMMTQTLKSQSSCRANWAASGCWPSWAGGCSAACSAARTPSRPP